MILAPVASIEPGAQSKKGGGGGGYTTPRSFSYFSHIEEEKIGYEKMGKIIIIIISTKK